MCLPWQESTSDAPEEVPVFSYDEGVQQSSGGSRFRDADQLGSAEMGTNAFIFDSSCAALLMESVVSKRT